MKANVTIKGAKNIPKLGLSTYPSAYVIVKIAVHQEVTSIYPSSCNPIWNYSTTIDSDFQLERVTFYVFNNNPNHVDELLGFGYTQYETFLTPVVTTSRILLKDATGFPLSSYLQIQHCNANPASNTMPPLNDRTTVRLNLLGITANNERSSQWIDSYKDKHVIIEYGTQIKQFSERLSVNTFKFQNAQPEILVRLQLEENIRLSGAILFDNITQNCSLRVRLYYGNHQIIVLLGASIIQNGLLLQNHNTLLVDITNIIIEPIKKVPKDWTVVIYGIFGRQLIQKTKQPCRLYIQNNTELQFQYFQENVNQKNLLDLEPIASHLIPVNSINWSVTLNSAENIKMYNPSRGIVISLDLKFTLLKNEKDSKLIPKFEKTNLNVFSDRNIIKVTQIKMMGACLNQIFTEKTMFLFIWVPNFGERTVFPSFQLKASIQYTVACRQAIQDIGGGQLLLVTFDHYFGKDQQNQNELDNYIICKIIGKDLQDLTQAPIIFHERFLSYAKKQSLAKNCKKFETMVRDKTLSLKVIGKRFPLFQPGFLTLHNCIMEGGRVRVNLDLVFDSNEIRLEGEWNDNLMTKPYIVCLKDNGIQIKVTEAGRTSQIHYEFQQIFGAPDDNTVYTTTISLPLQRKLTIIYSFSPTQSPPVQKPPLKILRFTGSTPIHMKIKSAFVPFDGFSQFRLRVSKSKMSYQTSEESPSSALIRFRDSEDMYFDDSDQNTYLFFNLYCKGKEGQLVIFAGHFNAKNMIGKGNYQLPLSNLNPQQKNPPISLTFQLLNDPQLSSPTPCLTLKLSPKLLQFSPPEYLRPVLKYYLVSEINNNPIGIFQLTKSEKGLIANQSVFVEIGDRVVWRLYCSVGVIGKDGFWGADKELVASGRMFWSQIQREGVLQLRFLPTKELYTKLSANKLALLENTVTVRLQYTSQPQQQTQLLTQTKPPKQIDIQVLHTSACKLTILQFQSYSSHQKILQLSLQPLQLNFHTQSRCILNKEFIVQLENMRMKLTMTKSAKVKDRYCRLAVDQEVCFRGRKMRTGDTVGFQVGFQGIGVMKISAVILSSKFTSNCRGLLKLLSFGCNNPRIKQIQLQPLPSPSHLTSPQSAPIPPALKLPLTKSPQPLTLQFQTSHIAYCLSFVICHQDKSRVKSLIYLADIPIDKLDDKPFRYQWVINNGKVGKDLVWIQGEYRGSQVEVLGDGEQVGYQLQAGNGVEVVNREFKTKEKIAMLKQINKLDLFRPDRKRGYRIVVTVPGNLEATSVTAIVADKKQIPLAKSQHNLSTYVYTSAEAIKVQTLSIASPMIDRMQQLQQKNFTRRFLINRDPSKIILLQQQPYAIADTKPQTILLNFHFHQIFSKQTKGKIMWMQNNKFDEILTRNFGLLVKHGKQKKIIRRINQTGQFQEMVHNGALLGEEDGDGLDKRTVRFGFEALSDQLEIFLFISHVLNQKEEAEALDCENIENWTKFLPVAYGKINLQKVSQKPFVGCQLKKIANFNNTIDKPLNDVIIRPNLNCLGSIHLQKRRWGLIYLQLEQVSTIQLQFPSENTLIFFSLEVENSRREKMAGVVTEARSFTNKSRLKFINNKCNFFYIENKDDGESLKIVATLLTFNNSFKLFQKRVDLSQYLKQPQTHNFATQLKPTQTKGLKSTTQIKLTLLNTSSPPAAQNWVEQANSINTVDMVTFQNYAQNEMIQKLIRCQQATHLLEVMNQVKQSVIYSKQSQIQLFRACGCYLQFQSDAKLIKTLLEMINVEIFKYPTIFQKLNEADIKRMYSYLKILFESKQLSLPRVQKKMSASDYNKSTQKLDLKNIDQILKSQKKHLYTNQQLIQPSSLAHIQNLIPIIEAFLQKSPSFKQMFKKDINQWSEAMMFKEDGVFARYLIMLGDVYGQQGMDAELAEDVFKRGLKKDIPMQSLIDVWAKLPKEKISIYAPDLFNKIIGRFGNTKQSQQSVHSFRNFINYVQMFKLEISEQLWKQVINKCQSLIKETKDLLILNLYSQLLVKFNSIGKLNEQRKMQVVAEIKKRLTEENDKNIRLSLNNLIDKLCGKKIVTTQEAVAAKTQFYKKYLITS